MTWFLRLPMQIYKTKVLSSNKKINYLLIGGVNTLFGYMIGVGLYELLVNSVGIVWIGVAANVLSIIFSFITYKLFVFRTNGIISMQEDY